MCRWLDFFVLPIFSSACNFHTDMWQLTKAHTHSISSGEWLSRVTQTQSPSQKSSLRCSLRYLARQLSRKLSSLQTLPSRTIYILAANKARVAEDTVRQVHQKEADAATQVSRKKARDGWRKNWYLSNLHIPNLKTDVIFRSFRLLFIHYFCSPFIFSSFSSSSITLKY